jgi:hypothetical protein
MVHGVVLRPLLYHEPDRLVRICETRGENPRFTWGEDQRVVCDLPLV